MGSQNALRDDPAVRWLLGHDEPAVRALALTDLLGEPPDAPQVKQARAGFFEGAWVRALLAGQQSDGGFGSGPYKKWTGAHWRLVSLVELGVPPGEPRALAAAEQVLAWLHSEKHRADTYLINGRTRRHASQEGNALAVCCRLGLARDPRVRWLAERLVEWQWPDGGWNCDRNPAAAHSSFYESLSPLWGLIEYHRATGNRAARTTARRAAELFLQHRLFRSDKTGEVINPNWIKLHYPLYWHYDVLQALVVLSRLGPLRDPRLADALEVVQARRKSDGRWQSGGRYWRARGTSSGHAEAVNWGGRGPNAMITLNALRVLKAAGAA